MIGVSRGPKIIPEVIIVGEREIVRMGKRWIVYLPIELNDVWETIKRQRRKVRIYIEVLEGGD